MKLFSTILFFFITSSFIFSENIHPSFNLSRQELQVLISKETDITKNLIMNSDYIFLNLIEDIIIKDESLLKLVDKTNRLTSSDIPFDIINLTDYNLHTRYKQMPFSKRAVNNFVEMSDNAKDLGIDLFIASTYRSWEFQDQIFTNMKNYHGEEKASTIVAYPGASQHQLGTAVDFGTITPSYAYTDAGKWLLNNAWKYGFTISYPEGKEDITTYMWEPWHYRYIGKSAALLQRNYFGDIQHYFLVFWDKYQLFFKEKHIH